MTLKQLEDLKRNLIEYYQEYILIVDFDAQGKLILLSNPYLPFDDVIFYVCENIFDTIYFEEHLEVRLYPFGENEYVEIGIN